MWSVSVNVHMACDGDPEMWLKASEDQFQKCLSGSNNQQIKMKAFTWKRNRLLSQHLYSEARK